MIASICYRFLRNASGAGAGVSALVLAALAATGIGEAADVYFPATSAYYRHNYDPFDQTSPLNQTVAPAANNQVIQQGTVTQQGTVAEQGTAVHSDVQFSGDIRLIAAERFAQSASVPSSQVIPAAMQAATSEPLPPPRPPAPRTNVGVADEPGADWAPKPLADLTTNIVLPGGVLPRDYWTERAPQHIAFFDPTGTTRGWPVNEFNWVASCFCSNPLYFEEINLERYGYGCGCFGPCCTSCVQSAVSGAHFFANVVALPYKMGADCPFDCDYTLGHYRPGSCPPWRWHCCSRCSALGSMSAAGMAAGLIFLIP